MTIDLPNLPGAFPDFDVSTLPAIPDDWTDASWRNDACPSFSWGDDEEAQVYVDFLDPADREFADSKRFSVCNTSDCLFSSDDWAAVVAFVEERRQAAAAAERDEGERDICSACWDLQCDGCSPPDTPSLDTSFHDHEMEI